MPRLKDHPKTYRQRCETFDPEQNPTCPNYVKAIEFAKTNGYVMSKDTSYNGYIFFEKIICDGEYKFELQVYNDIIMADGRWPHLEVYNKELSNECLEKIMTPISFVFKTRRENLPHNTPDLDTLFARALEMEKICTDEETELLKKYPRKNEERFSPFSPTVDRNFKSKVPGIHYLSKNFIDSHLIQIIHEKSKFPINIIMLKLSESVLEAIDAIDGHLKQCDWDLDRSKCTEAHKKNVQEIRDLFDVSENYIHTLKK